MIRSQSRKHMRARERESSGTMMENPQSDCESDGESEREREIEEKAAAAVQAACYRR